MFLLKATIVVRFRKISIKLTGEFHFVTMEEGTALFSSFMVIPI